MLRLLVPIKRVIDYNARIRVKADKTGVVTEGVRMSLNPFCEIAVEEAVRLKEQSKAKDVTVISVGGEKVQEVLRTALAMGADHAVHLEAEEGLHPLVIAGMLTALVQSRPFDLIIMGKQAIDDDYNQTGQMLAGMLKWPQATFASEVKILDDGRAAEVCREVDGGLEHLQVKLPAVITTDLRLNAPRYATLPRIMKAKRATIENLKQEDLSYTAPTSQLDIVQVDSPPERQQGIIVKSVKELVERLRTDRQVI